MIAGVCVLLLSIAALSFYLAKLENDFFLDSLLQQGKNIAEVVEAGASNTLSNAGNYDSLQPLLDQLVSAKQVAFIAITDFNGTIQNLSSSNQVAVPKTFNLDNFKSKDPGTLYSINKRQGWNNKVLQFAQISSFAQTPIGNKSEANTNTETARKKSSLIFIGLHMQAMENAILRNSIQFIILVIVLVGCGIGLTMLLAAKRGFHRSLHAFRDIKTFSSLLLARLPSGVVATGSDGRVKIFNEAAIKMTGSLKGEIINRKAHKVLPALLRGYTCRMQESDEIIDRELDFPAPEGVVPLHICSVPIHNGHNETRGRVLLMHDLTEIKKLRHEIQRHERFVAMGKMAAGVAHEIRNPLNSIKGLSIMLGNSFDEGTKKWETAQLLCQEVDRLNRNISDLLDYSRPLYLKLGKVDINKLLSDIIILMESEYTAAKVVVLSDLHHDLPELTIDGDRIKQVLMNIILNAIQAMEGGGTLTVISRPAEEAKQVEIIVRDTGCGIPEEDLDKIFDPYFTTKDTGTGLGLAMAYKIIQAHGGKFHITSEDEVGSTVRLELKDNPGLVPNRQMRNS